MAHGVTHYTTPGYGTLNPYLSRSTDGGLTREMLPWWNFPPLDAYKGVKTIVYSIEPGLNLVGFPFKFYGTQNALSTVIPPGSGITEIYGESTASTVIGGAWVGSVSTISGTNGYWVNNTSGSVVSLTIRGASLYGSAATDVTWSSGNNLISYPLSFSEGLDESIQYTLTGNNINSFHTSSFAASWIDSTANFVGSLDKFNQTKGYWVNIDSGITAEVFWEKPYPGPMSGHPIEGANKNFWYDQSTTQCFYMFRSGCYDKDGIELVPGDDWLATFRGDVCCGSMFYNGREGVSYTNISPTFIGFDFEVPAMRQSAENPYTPGSGFGQYDLVTLEEPSFVIYKLSEDKYYRAEVRDFATDVAIDMSNYKVATNEFYGGIESNWKLQATTEIK